MRRLALVLLLAFAAGAAANAGFAQRAQPQVARSEPKASEAHQAGEQRSSGGPRVVTLSPSLTAILLAIDAGDAVVGVDDSSAQVEPRVRDLPRVGGLFNP